MHSQRSRRTLGEAGALSAKSAHSQRSRRTLGEAGALSAKSAHSQRSRRTLSEVGALPGEAGAPELQPDVSTCPIADGQLQIREQSGPDPGLSSQRTVSTPVPPPRDSGKLRRSGEGDRSWTFCSSSTSSPSSTNGTFTRAAERVGRTQPAISQSIKKLEEEVGAPLFARDVHDVSLTEAGRVLVEYARRMVAPRDDAMRMSASLKTLKTGTLNIAAHESAAVYLLPAPLRTYLQKFPDIKVGIYRSRLAEIPRQVLDREVDVGFVKDEPAFHELKWVDVHADEMMLIASSGHPLARRADVRVRDLGGEQFVLHHLCSTTEQKILQAVRAITTRRCRIVAELWSFENIKSFVQEDVGLAIVPGVTVARNCGRHARAAFRARAADSASDVDDLSRAGVSVGSRARTDQDRPRASTGTARSRR